MQFPREQEHITSMEKRTYSFQHREQGLADENKPTTQMLHKNYRSANNICSSVLIISHSAFS